MLLVPCEQSILQFRPFFFSKCIHDRLSFCKLVIVHDGANKLLVAAFEMEVRLSSSAMTRHQTTVIQVIPSKY